MTTELFFYGPTTDALAALADDLIGLGALVPEPAQPSAADEDELLLMAYAPVSVLDPEFDAFDDAVTEAAQRHGCEYDGHGTYVGPIELLAPKTDPSD